MFHDIQPDITNNVKRLQELKKLHPDGQIEIEVRIMKYGGKEVSQTDFLRLRNELDALVKSSAGGPSGPSVASVLPPSSGGGRGNGPLGPLSGPSTGRW